MSDQTQKELPPQSFEGSRSIYGPIVCCIEALVERLGMVALVALLVPVIFFFGAVGAFFLDESIQGHVSQYRTMFPGIELAVIPLSALIVARWRLTASRLMSLRKSVLGPYLALLMAATLVGLIAYLEWSWRMPPTTVGPDRFGLVRWLGTALAAAFTIVWLPLFPRITATLAGMIAGPALFAVVGYSFFGSQMQIHDPGGDGPGGLAIGLSFLGTLVWIVGAVWLSRQGGTGDGVPKGEQPLAHAIWSGAIMLCLAVLGTTFEHIFY